MSYRFDISFRRTASRWGLYSRTISNGRGPALLRAYIADIVVAARSSEDVNKVLNVLGKGGILRSWGRNRPSQA
jgi:hypothetical protein